MLKKKTILETAVCYWSPGADCYVVESPLLPAVIAAEETAEAAFNLYESMLENAWQSILKDKVHGFKRGKPPKNGAELNALVQPDTKQMIDHLRDKLGISQGEFIDLVTFHYAKKCEPTPASTALTTNTTIGELFAALKPKQAASLRSKGK
jgi:predicted RNase H-like HicB family nuclease